MPYMRLEAPRLAILSHGASSHEVPGAGSCLVLKGNGADVAMHCVPPVSEKRMSITLRRCHHKLSGWFCLFISVLALYGCASAAVV